MISRTMIGRLLILGPIGMFASWFGWSMALGNPDSGDHAAMIAAVSQNPESTKWLLGLAGLFMFFMIGGLTGLRNTMTGGPGSSYAALGVLIIIMSGAFNLSEIALIIVAGDVGAAGNASAATTIYLAGNGIGAVSSAGIFLGFATLGLGVYIQKNFSSIIACLLIATTLIGLVTALYDYGNILMAVGFIGMTISVVAMGVSTLRSSE
ncbi:hypothetical protein FIM02_00375 [SAR202 cluster bacterium AD-802-E10_MRT_200m]|nr:hypothetical protein [SAR202 cluster bacterium AD-802-E10_MRT_200m]